MYNKLLIQAGGGIVSRNQQAEQDNCATVAIGLGGTGISCLRAFKRAVYTRVAPDPTNDFVPRYSHIQFLAVDTDKSSLGSTASVDTLDEATEFFNISCSDIQALLSKAHILQQDPSLQWLKTASTEGNGGGISILSTEAGAGGVRQIGRLLLLQNCTAFVDKLRLCITNACRGLVDNSINIHIFTGMSGGTGAGTFLDVCYLVQYVLNEMGVGGRAFTCGYFFLPDVNIAAGVTKDYIPINGFASMKELDYAMNFANNGGEWDQQYPGFRIKTSAPPVKLAHLISATDAQGSVLADGFSYAMNTVTEYVLEYVIKPSVSNDTDQGEIKNQFTLASHIANVRQLIDGVKKKYGACYDYCILGAANTYMPYKEITTYLAARIFQEFSYLNAKLPSDSDMDGFVRDNRLRYEDILGDLSSHVPGVPNFDVDIKTLYDQVQGISAEIVPGLLAPMRDSTSKIEGLLDTNKDAMLADKPSVAGDKKAADISILGRVKTALVELATMPEKGPFYATALLYSQRATDITNILRGYQTRCNEDLKKANGDLELREKGWRMSLNEFQNSTFMNRKNKAAAYKNAIFSYYSQEVKITRLKRMHALLIELETQMNALYENFFSVFSDVMVRLQQTFGANYDYLVHPVVSDTAYAEPIFSIGDMVDTLESAVEAMAIPDQVHKFVKNMMDNPSIWNTRDETLISAFVSEYFLGELGAWTSRTIDDYLKEKFGTNDPAQLKDKIYREIIQPLGRKSEPLFWIDSGMFSTSEADALGYLSFPNVSESTKRAASDYVAANSGISMRESCNRDRITIFRFLCGVPLVAYKGVANYIGAYHSRAIVGSHLYEKSSGDIRDSRAYRDIFPFSAKAESELTQEERSGAEMYARAIEEKVITTLAIHKTVEYHLNVFDGAMLEQWSQELNEARTKRPGSLRATYQEYKSRDLPILSYRIIPNTGYKDYADKVVRDHVIGSLLDMKILGEQLSAVARFNEALERASEELDIGGIIKEFASALQTGVITKKGNYDYMYSAEYEEYELTTMESKPYGDVKSLVLYSAFVGYRALSAAVKDEIKRETKQRLQVDGEDDAVTQKITDALAKVQADLAEDKVKIALSTARDYPDDTAVINLFFRTLKESVSNFASMR